LVNEVVAPGAHLERALQLAEGLAAFPQETMLSDRRAAIVGSAMAQEPGLGYEADAGRAVIETAIRGAGRFAGGAGRGGAGAGA
jgi:enoyl-CoA hydratase